MVMRKQPNSYDCFICGVENAAGVHVDFYERYNEEGAPEVLAHFTGQAMHQGYPGRMHGGVITGVLDETIGRAVNTGDAALNPAVWGVTVEVNVQFHKPVPLEVKLTAVGRITHERARFFEGTGELYLPDGEVAATAMGKYVKLAADDIADLDAEALGWRVYE
jgi:acyl-coenzyme A thioesterase PaaI-like protein